MLQHLIGVDLVELIVRERIGHVVEVVDDVGPGVRIDVQGGEVRPLPVATIADAFVATIAAADQKLRHGPAPSEPGGGLRRQAMRFEAAYCSA